QSVVSVFWPGPGLDTVHPSSPHGSDPMVSDAPMSLPIEESGAKPRLQVPRSQPLCVETLATDNRPPGPQPAPVAAPNTLTSNGGAIAIAPGPARQRLLQRVQGLQNLLVTAPENRDALLERLRLRARSLPRQHDSSGPAALTETTL